MTTRMKYSENNTVFFCNMSGNETPGRENRGRTGLEYREWEMMFFNRRS